MAPAIALEEEEEHAATFSCMPTQTVELASASIDSPEFTVLLQVIKTCQSTLMTKVNHDVHLDNRTDLKESGYIS